ncbi:MAG: protein kinase [Acidobacteriota bacterium]
MAAEIPSNEGKAPANGDFLLHYRIDQPLGRGGMGAVYRAWDTKLQRDVAIKVVLPETNADPERRRRFLREARAASALNHPGIVSIYEINQQDEMDFLVMELVHGQTLSSLMRSRRLQLKPALDYMTQAAEALAKAHLAGIVHRDLKPANIMLTTDGQIKILDFGLAKFDPPSAVANDATQSLTLTAVGHVMGTPSYMSPEQAMGMPLDVRSDVFSFGVILYEILVGARPFEGTTPFAILHNVTSVEPPSLTTVRGDLPPALIELVDHTLKKSPAERLGDMMQVVARLRSVAASIPATASPEDVATQTIAVASAATYPPPSIPSALISKVPSTARRRVYWTALAMAASLLAIWGGASYRGSTSPAETKQRPLAGIGKIDMTLPARELHRAGLVALKRHDFPENIDLAIDAFKSAKIKEPNWSLPDASLALAYARKYTNSPDPTWLRLAEQHAAEISRREPTLAVAHFAAGVVHVSAGRLVEARKSLERAIELDPSNAEAHFVLARALDPRTDAARARSLRQHAVELAPQDWETHLEWGIFLFRQGEFTAAAEAFSKSASFAPDNAIAQRNLAGALQMMDRYDEAATAYQRALEIRPSASTFSNLGTLLYFQGKYADAAAALERAVELGANSFRYWGNLADALRWLPGKEARGQEALTHAIALARTAVAAKQQDTATRSNLAAYLAKSGLAQEAIAEAARIDLTAVTGQTAYNLAVAQELSGQRAQALQLLDTAVKKGHSLKEIQNDPYLVKLRADADYHRWLSRLPPPAKP